MLNKMDSPSIYRYRVRERWIVDDNGYKTVKYYPQYKSKFYGWRNIFEQYSYKYFDSLTPSHFGIFVLDILGPITMSIGLFMISSLNFYGIVLFVSTVLFMWGSRYLVNTTSTDGLKAFNSIDEAKRYVSERINRINEELQKQKRKHETEGNLPDDKIHYLDIKVGRTEKLKRINRLSKLGF